MKKLFSNNGCEILVDDSDFDLLSNFKWYIVGRSYCDTHRYAITRIDGKTVSMHRMIMMADKGEVIDHKNHNTLDNRRCNLRKCSSQQNMQNMTKRTNGSSKYKGVQKRDNRWRATIGHNRKTVYLGSFVSENEAAQAYNEAASRLYGKFAFINILQ